MASISVFLHCNFSLGRSLVSTGTQVHTLAGQADLLIYRHHPTDIIAGSTIGTILALIIYHIYHPTPFLSSNYDIMPFPRKTHKELTDEQMDVDGDAEEEEALLGDERV